MAPNDVVVIIGSLRQGSHTRRLVQALQDIAPGSMRLDIVEIGHLPLFNPDLEAAPPAEWTGFQGRIRQSGAVLFATPEHNRSIPAALKNAIDIGSRPPGKNAWAGKAAAILTTSSGSLGGFGANHHLRQCLMHLDLAILAQPEVYLGTVDKLITEQGQFAGDSTRALCARFLTAFEAWILRLRQVG